MVDEAWVWSCGRGHQVQLVIRVKVLALPGCCLLQTVIGSTSRAAWFNEKLQDLDLTNFFYAHDDCRPGQLLHDDCRNFMKVGGISRDVDVNRLVHSGDFVTF